MSAVGFVIAGIVLVGAVAWLLAPVLLARLLPPIRAENLGFKCRGSDLELANEVGTAFRAGARARLLRGPDKWVEPCEAAGRHYRPFAYEGAALGHSALCSVGRAQWPMLNEQIIARQPGMTYLFHVGVGFWGAFRYGRRPAPLFSHIQTYDPLYRYLCLDGYGFKFGFFDFLGDRSAIDHLCSLPGYYRNAAYQGFGRSLWFCYMQDRRGLFETVSSVGAEHDTDVIAGTGLAASFAHVHEPDRALDLAVAVPAEWRKHVHLGITFGFKARQLADRSYFEQCVQVLPTPVVSTMLDAIGLCDAVEADVRSRNLDDPYRTWREELTEQMEQLRLWDRAHDARAIRAPGVGSKP